MRVIHRGDDLAEALHGSAPAFVPTMGALHEGHVALIRHARSIAVTSRPVRSVVVSIFVNPTQFGPNEDFARYPRRLEQDAAAARLAGADLVFAPEVGEVYPPGLDLRTPALPAVATQPRLEDARRPTHFAGVVQVVARLFDLVKPSVAVFGEKDYQQLRVIQDMVAAEVPSGRWGALRIEPHPTIREPGGLAMSSRNAYLTTEQRECALGLNRALDAANIVQLEDAEREMAEVLQSHDLEIDYAVVRDAHTLLEPATARSPLRALIAARIGSVRLIDNMAIDRAP